MAGRATRIHLVESQPTRASRLTPRRRPMFRILACSALAALLIATPEAQGPTIRVWKVGSPHTGDVPHTRIPLALSREADGRGWRLSIEAFPAQAFASRFLSATRNGTAPDVLVFDNMGIMNGIVTKLGAFEGIGQDPAIRNQLIQVTSSFDELLGPARGWAFLFSSSENYVAARELALRTPRCKDAPAAPRLPIGLAVPEVAAAYLAGDNARLQRYADPQRLSGLRPNLEPVTVGDVAVCGSWGNERLAFVTVNASYHADTTLGHASLLLGFRRTSSLVATDRCGARSDLESRLRHIVAEPLQSPGPGHFGRPSADARHIAITRQRPLPCPARTARASGTLSGSRAPAAMSSLKSPSSDTATMRVSSCCNLATEECCSTCRRANSGQHGTSGPGACGRSQSRARSLSRKRERSCIDPSGAPPDTVVGQSRRVRRACSCDWRFGSAIGGARGSIASRNAIEAMTGTGPLSVLLALLFTDATLRRRSRQRRDSAQLRDRHGQQQLPPHRRLVRSGTLSADADREAHSRRGRRRGAARPDQRGQAGRDSAGAHRLQRYVPEGRHQPWCGRSERQRSATHRTARRWCRWRVVSASRWRSPPRSGNPSWPTWSARSARTATPSSTTAAAASNWWGKMAGRFDIEWSTLAIASPMTSTSPRRAIRRPPWRRSATGSAPKPARRTS